MSIQVIGTNPQQVWVDVAVDVPKALLFTYLWVDDMQPEAGMRVVIPWGNKKRIGIVWNINHDQTLKGQDRIKPIHMVLNECGSMSEEWIQLIEFAANYYHYPVGQAALDAIPKPLKTLGTKGAGLTSVKRLIDKLLKNQELSTHPINQTDEAIDRVLNQTQQAVLEEMNRQAGFKVFLLYGITGSGKTEVYLQKVQQVCRQGKQALVLLPEINLTPQTEKVFKSRLAGLSVVILNSSMADMPRLENWWKAKQGLADVVIGTRLAVFTPMPRLGLVIVDEEHDPSYKQMEGLKYSARDLAITRGHMAHCQVILGSATPSLESWHKSDNQVYQRLEMTERAVSVAKMPSLILVNTSNQPMRDGLAEPVLEALKLRFEKQEQSIVFLNRRGYAPLLACGSCGWVAGCKQCSSHMVWHRGESLLRCHHCGAQQIVPKHCPTCGNQDLSSFGRGTQRVEETIQQLLPTARLLRIDADTTRNKGQAEEAFEKVHAGDADILVGTQMVAKGHDFKKVSLVIALNVDAALFSCQARAPERLFAQLMQVAGRAGRHGLDSEVMIQTRYPHHSLFESLVQHDYPGFARTELEARQTAHMPPFAFQALLRADHKQLQQAVDFLNKAKSLGEALLASTPGVWMCDAVPLTVVRVAGVERAQLLIESPSRGQLHQFLNAWLPLLYAEKGSVRWFLEVDPQDV